MKTKEELAKEYSESYWNGIVGQVLIQSSTNTFLSGYEAGFSSAVELLKSERARRDQCDHFWDYGRDELVEWLEQQKEAGCVGCRESCGECRD